jgi:hypothetical protein
MKGYIMSNEKTSILAGIGYFSIGAAVVAGGIYLFINTSPYTEADAQRECQSLAENFFNDDEFFPDVDIRVGSTWVKNGARVAQVEIREDPSDLSFNPRICVLQDGQVRLVSVFEQAAWR